ncbi:MAG TPA: zinc metalloprotease HtpX [Dehalococcoidia bacterium]|nr:zinc metalloprotease HtpX [Dehalococcoidia bacterium]
MSNAVKTAVLLGALTGLFAGLGYLIFGGLSGLLFFLILAGVMNFIAYWFSDKLALRMAGAREVTPQEEPHLHALVAEVAELAGVPKPKVYIVETETPNAFATGRNPQHAVVAVTTGIRRILTERELRAVIGHEIGHVKNRDILTSSIAATIAGAISYIQTVLFWGAMFGGRDREGGNPLIALFAAMIGALVAGIIQMAISRTREYAADQSGAEYTRDPEALASALAKLHNGVQMRPMEQTPGTEATAPLYIVHPFRMGEGLSNLFSTHPPVEERIKRLRRLAGYVVE